MPGVAHTDVGVVPEKDVNCWSLVCHYMAPVMEYYQDPDITEIMINGFDSIFVEDRNGMRHVDRQFESEQALETLITQISIALKQDVENLEKLDARFPDQSRACCTTRNITPLGSSITIRCAPKKKLSFANLVEFKTLTQEMCDYIQDRVESHDNIIISGGTASGKTTLIRAIGDFIPRSERVIVCEDTQELFLSLPNQLLMEAPDRKGSNMSLADLIKTSLRQRPDRVLVGEIRDALACDAFLQIINTGHSGCITSLHANSPTGAVRRIQYLLSKEGLIDYALAGQEVLDSLNLLIQVKKTAHGRRITHVSRVDEEQKIIDVFRYDENDDAHIRL